MNELEALTAARDRHVSDAELFESRAREARFVERTLTKEIENLKAAQEGRPHAMAKFRIGQKVRFTKEALKITNWYSHPSGWQVTKNILTVTGYKNEHGTHSLWDTVLLSDGTSYASCWLEDAEETS